MAQRFTIHRTTPQQRLLRQAAGLIRSGALAVLPTDACYALACRLDDKAAVDRLRALRAIDERHLLTLMCRDLAEISTYAVVDNRQYRFIKALTPGAYTFVLPATREVPRRLAHPSRKTVGMRVPDSPVIAGLLAELGEPVLASTLTMPGEDAPLADPDEIEARIGKRIDLLVDAGTLGTTPTSIIDLTGDEPTVVRIGCGPVDRLVTI